MSNLDEVMRPNRLAMQTVGLWPEPFGYLRFGFAVVSLVSLVVPQLYSVAYYWGDIKYIAETGNMSLIFLLLLLKLLYAAIRRREFARLQHYMEVFWRASDDATERENFERPAKLGRTLTVVAFWFTVADLVVIVVAALIVAHEQNRRVLPVDLVYGFDYESNAIIFAILYVAQLISLSYTILVFMSFDACLSTVVPHIIGQLRLINYRLRAIGANRQLTKTALAKSIGRCIEHHQLVIGVADWLSDLMSPMVSGQFLCSGLQICISGYAVIEGIVSGFMYFKCAVYFSSVLVQLILWYVPGDFLEEESGRVATTVCHELPWFELPKSLQRDLLFMLTRAQKNCKIAALYQTTNIAKLTDVFKAAGSYMALLRSFSQ